MKWFKEVFLPSFGLCEGKRITEKQANVFIKYLDEEETKGCWNAVYYHKIVNGLDVRLQESLVYNGCYYNKTGRHTRYGSEYYVTIKEHKEQA